jgi:hypothetical protein
MAKLMVIGNMAHVEILTDPEDEEVVLAQCVRHLRHPNLSATKFCPWEQRYLYGGMGEAVNSASVHRHADGG